LRAILIIVHIIFYITSSSFSQFEQFYIEVRSDSNPDQISWRLSDEDGQEILTDRGIITNVNEVYNLSITVNKSDCYRFDIFDSGGDGIQIPGYYRIRRGDIWIQGEYLAFKENNFHYSGDCSKGKSCLDPMPITSKLMYGPNIENYWYELNVDESSYYSVTTCSNSEMDTDDFLDTKLWIYDSCPQDISNGPEGALVFNDDFPSCLPASGVYNYYFEANRKFIIRIGLNGVNINELLEVSFEPFPEVSGCMDPNSCNYNPFANAEDGTCVYEDCFPDLAIGIEEYRNSVFLDTIYVDDDCLLEESCVNGLGKRHIIRFTTAIFNVGNTDYVVGRLEEDVIGFSNDNCHEHWHRLGYAEYLLYGGAGKPEPLGFKNGFCVLDISCGDSEKNPKYSCDFMGITAGCFDVYDTSVECQWLDVTDVPDGDYTMVARINWNQLPDLRGKREKTFENNWAQICINLDRSNGTLVMKVFDECPEYRDCMGVAFGPAVEDCNGVCGGQAHYGDANEDLKLNSTDIDDYLILLENKSEASPCTDLDGNGLLTIYDAVLLDDCLYTYDENDPLHNHCLFPYSVDNQIDRVELVLYNFDSEQKSFEVGYISEAPIKAFHFRLIGVGNIISIENLADVDFQINSNFENEIFAFINDHSLNISSTLKPLLKVNYEGMPDSRICIDEVIEIIDNKSQKLIAVNLFTKCEVSTRTHDEINKEVIKIWPNPSSGFLFLDWGNRKPDKIEMIDNHGELIEKWETVNTHQIRISMNTKKAGLYFILVWFEDEYIGYPIFNIL